MADRINLDLITIDCLWPIELGEGTVGGETRERERDREREREREGERER